MIPKFLAGASALLGLVLLMGCTSPYGQEPAPALPELQSLTLEGQGKTYDLVPTFSPGQTAYTLAVPYSLDRLTLEAVPAQSNLTVSGTGDWDLTEGENSRSLVVTAPSGSIRTYTLLVTRAVPSSDAALKSLSVSAGEEVLVLDPPFSPGVLSYYADVGFAVQEVTLSAEAGHPYSQLVGTGPAGLSEGLNTLSVTVTSESGIGQTYKIIINRFPQNMQIVEKPVFDPPAGLLAALDTPVGITSATPGAVIRYTLGDGTQPSPSRTSGTVYDSADKPKITRTAMVIKAVAYKEGLANSGVVTAVYSLPATDAFLASLTVTTGAGTASLSPAFSPEILSYKVTVSHGTTTLTLGASPRDPGATVTGTGVMEDLVVGPNPDRAVVVTAADGITVLTYTLTITRAKADASTEAALKSLSLSTGTLSPAFSSGTTAYSTGVGWSTEEMTLTAEAAHPGALVSGDGNRKLAVGTNTLILTVTAEAGNTATYTVTVTREKPPQGQTSLPVTLQNPGEPALTWTLGGVYGGTLAGNDLTLTQGAAPLTVAVSAPVGTLGTLTWRINGTTIHMGNDLSLSPADLSLGPQQLVLRFVHDGQEYSQSVRITVRN